MKIVSKTKDYYDHVANILGVDEKLRYDRRPFRMEKLFDGTPFIPEFTGLPLPRSLGDAYKAAFPASPFFRYANPNARGDWRTLKALFVGGRAFTALCAPGKDGIKEDTPGPYLVRAEVECPDWLFRLSYHLDQPVFLVASMQPGHDKVEVMNMPPNLAEMGLPRLLDAFTAYSTIQTWMENRRSARDPLNGIPETDNNIKIQAAGFDLKTSFRGPSGRRQRG